MPIECLATIKQSNVSKQNTIILVIVEIKVTCYFLLLLLFLYENSINISAQRWISIESEH